MKVSEIRFFVGVNLYSDTPVCRLRIEADQPGEIVDTPIPTILLQRSLNYFPRLQKVLETLNPAGVESTHSAHLLLALIELVAAELGWKFTYKNIVRLPEGDGLDLLFSFEERRVTNLTVNFALGLLQRLKVVREVDIHNLRSTLQHEFQAFLQQAMPLCRNIDTRYLHQSAKARGIPATELLHPHSIIFGHGRYQKRMWKKMTPATSWAAFHIAQNKPLTNLELRRVGLPVTDQVVVTNREAVSHAARQLGYPLVVKPASSDMGVGITIGIHDEQSLVAAFDRAKRYSPSVLLERFIEGDEFRLLVINGKLVAAAHRVPAHVVGDGRHSIRELVDLLSRDPRRGTGKRLPLSLVELDHEAETVLAKAGYTLDDIPPQGKQVFLRWTSNLSRGGTSIDVTPIVHPDNEAMAVLAALVIGLDIAGIDFITPDISRSWKDVGGKICEINPTPGLRMHYASAEGASRDVAAPIFDMLFPPGEPSRIPVAVITGSNGKTTTTRMSAHILRHSGACVGITSTDGVYVDDEQVRAGDLAGGTASQQLLIDPRIDAAVLETARGGILKVGTGIDRCDVTAVTNIAEEHLGELGVETREDMAKVKGLLVELAHKMVVLGADDPLTAGLAERSRAERVCFISKIEDNPLVEEHIATGHPAVRLEQVESETWLVLYDNKKRYPLLSAADIPASLGGIALFNLENAMCAAAVTYGLDQNIESIVESLRTFKNDSSVNPCRMNFIDGFPFTFVIDHCHTYYSLSAVGPVVRKIDADKRILVFSMPGNRRETDFSLATQVAAEYFDEFHLYTMEKYLRGRTQNELTDLLFQGLREAGIPEQALFAHDSEHEAVNNVLERAQEGDLVLVASLNYDELYKQIMAYIEAD
ncbi:Mur ligase family protein [Solemya elarraichensis gill symbiont]|uniref:ATP-grasp domain-containing protein n=1 Tax=Solemya elarraichensis gill symbiont TaxID=1918949 RepID=A0A1T2L3M4_9GAMM|nr:Mur ligase family protein [Solemya elarraichensis gill symbiont]OOZ39703.1 hypothetical protein BOW52_06950 [Solemya elarraichensis gill symbiont]